MECFDLGVEIISEIRAAKDDDNRRRIITWLTGDNPDPSKQHHIAREKHEKTTGSWLVDGASFEKWLTAPNSFMWLHGGGKTIGQGSYCEL